MEHNFEPNIKCPYCDWEDQDSWEFDSDSDVVTCGSCEKDFNVKRDIEVTYSTTRIPCEDDLHKYELKSHFIKDKIYELKGWVDLPESEWKFYKHEICSECGDKNYTIISKDEYHHSKSEGF